MASEPLYSLHPNLESGEKLIDTFTPGVTPPPAPQPPSGTTRHTELVDWIKREVNGAERNHVSKWREDYLLCAKFIAGDQLDSVTRRELRIQHRPDSAFNVVQKYVHYVSGIERRSPHALIFQPTVVDDQMQQVVGEYTTNVYEWVTGRCDAAAERSRAFADTLTGGLGWTDTYLEYVRDPKGLINIVRCPPNEMLWPDCAEENLRTTRWRARESLIDKDDCIRRWPDHEMLIRTLAGKSGDDRQFPDGPTPVLYTVPYIETEPLDKSGTGKPDKRGKLKVLQFQYYNDEEGWMFDDPASKEAVWLNDKDFALFKRRLQIIMPTVAVMARKAPHRVFYTVYLLERKYLLADPKRLPGDRFSLNAITGHFDEAQRLWYGFTRIMMDPQRYANTFFRNALETIATSAKSGAIAESDAFSNADQQHDFEDNYAKPGSTQIVAPGALGKIKPKDPPQIPAAAMAMMEFCIKSMDNITGLSTMGMGGDTGGGQMPGVTMQQQQQVGFVLMATEFDALSRYRKDEGRTVIAHAALLDEGRMILIGGPMGTKITMPLLRAPFLLEYELILDDTEHDPTLRAKYTNFILQAGPMLAKQGLFVPSMFNYLPFPVRIRQEIIQAMNAAQQQQQEAAAQGINLRGRGAPRDPRETQARIEKMQADAMRHRAQAIATMASTRRDDLRAVVDTIQGAGKHRMEQHRHALDRDKLGFERQRHATDTIVQLLQALQQPQGGAR